jgi:hypothetical protein
LLATVDAGMETGPPIPHSQKTWVRSRSPGEATLQIHFDHKSKLYRYQLIDDAVGGLKETSSGRLARLPEVAVEKLVRQLDEIARAETKLNADQCHRLLKNLGIDLWEELIPEELQRQFWERRDRIQRLFILSDDNPFPWELLYPFRPGLTESGFLAEQFTVVRWMFGDPPVCRIPIGRAEFVLPEGSPESAIEEVKALQTLFRGSRIEPQRPMSNLDDLLRLFDHASFHLLHFACHNTFDPDSPLNSHVRMGREPFQAAFLNEHRGRFRQASPVVFMNACRTDGRAPLYTRVTGWAQQFLAAGAGAFLGTQWEVRDESARTFAEEFYRSLVANKNLGDSVQHARRAVKDEHRDPTWLSYTFYGDPTATITGLA